MIQCRECWRTFNLEDPDDRAEWFYGHDCEPPEGPLPAPSSQKLADDYADIVLAEVVALSDAVDAANENDAEALGSALRELELDHLEDMAGDPFGVVVSWINESCLDVQPPDADWPTGSILRTCGGPHAEVGLAPDAHGYVAVCVWWGGGSAYRSVRAPFLAGLLSEVFDCVSA